MWSAECGILSEIVSVNSVDRLFLGLAIFGPVAGLIAGALFGLRLRRIIRCALVGLLVGCIGPMNYALWKLSGAITSRLGLDSVVNLLIQAAIFLILGFSAGIIVAGARGPRPGKGNSS